MSIKLFAFIILLAIFAGVIELTRRERLTFKYAFGWLAMAVTGAVLVVFDQQVEVIAHFFGFELASNFIFFIMLAGFVMFGLVLTIFLCQQDKQNDVMAQKIGLLEQKLEQSTKDKE